MLRPGLVLLLVLLLSPVARADEFMTRTRWVMGTYLRIHLPADRADLDTLFRSCFDMAQQWDNQLSPWQDTAPLTRLSHAAGRWIALPADVMAYLERAKGDARRSGGLFDITLTWEGSAAMELDPERGRARVPRDLGPLDPGGDGKGVALDAMAEILRGAKVTQGLIDFGGSSYLALGSGPEGRGWPVALTGAGGQWLGTLRLRDTALSVSSTVQRRRQEDGTVQEKFHLINLTTGEPVRARRAAVVLAASATEAEVASTVAAITGEVDLEGFPAVSVGIFDEANPTPATRGRFTLFFEPLE
ncbi:hypothetical protein CSB20_11885 [bacterium DOLZORAL124_64_63]|nr:MAG: hypothetical protein CSB20_11885 [bacterium DOLZORAL124_64_63]